jgi:hypothetical protein
MIAITSAPLSETPPMSERTRTFDRIPRSYHEAALRDERNKADRLREALREVRALWPYDDDRKLTAILDRALGDTPDECQE